MNGLLFALLLAAATDPAPSPRDEEVEAARLRQGLAAFAEAPLRGEGQRTVYRLLRFPAFSPSLMVRVERAADRAVMTWKEREIKDGAELPLRTGTRSLTLREWATIEGLVEKASFWTLPPRLSDVGLDGVTYRLEGGRGRGHHLVSRWSPDDGSFLRLCRHLIELARPPGAAPAVVDPRRPSVPGHMVGNVSWSTAKPAAGLTVRLAGGGVEEVRTTDVRGQFTIAGLETGLYQLSFERLDEGRLGTAPGFVRLAPGESNCVQISIDVTPTIEQLDGSLAPAITTTTGCGRR